MPYARDSLATISARVKTDIATGLAALPAFYRQSFERGLGLAVAGASWLMHEHLAWIARQLDPTQADLDMLEKLHGAPIGVLRKGAASAQIYVSAPGTNGTTIPGGTYWRRADGLRFRTDASVVIASGAAALTLTAEDSGSAYNVAAGDVLTIDGGIPGVTGTATVTGGVVDGADVESRDDYLRRVLFRKATPPKGGGEGDYAAWAMEVPGVTRAWEFPRREGAGTITVYAVNDNGFPITLSPTKMTEILSYMRQAGRAPSDAEIRIYTPTLVAVPITGTLTPNTVDVRAAVAAEVGEFFRRVGTPGGMTVLKSELDESISVAPGELDHALTAPAANVVIPFGSLPVPGALTWS